MASLLELMEEQENIDNHEEQTDNARLNLTVESLEVIIEMVEHGSLELDEETELMESIEEIFNNILDEAELTEEIINVEVDGVEWDTDDKSDLEGLPTTVKLKLSIPDDASDEESIEDYIEDELSNEYGFAHNGWESYKVLESEDIEGETLEEATLKKTSAKKRKASKRYARSAAGKKSKKIAAKKRKKYATKISRCSGKGKTFSFKAMTCVKPKKRR